MALATDPKSGTEQHCNRRCVYFMLVLFPVWLIMGY